MRSLRVSLYGLFAVACFGCPGTIDDPAAYEGFRSPGTIPDSVVDDVDAGQLAPAEDEPVVQPEQDAWTAMPSDPTPSVSDAATSDAGNLASPLSDAGGADAGSGTSCNFKALMQMKCGSAACHGGPANSTGLDLTSEGLAVRVSGRRGSGGCEDYLMVDTAQPDQSTLYLKVTGSACGVRMPVGGSLSAAEQACILQWIDNL